MNTVAMLVARRFPLVWVATLLATLVVAIVVVLDTRSIAHRFEQAQRGLAETSVQGTARLLEDQLRQTREKLELFAHTHAARILSATRTDDQDLWQQHLARAAAPYFDGLFAVSLADSHGNLLVDDFDGRVEAVCQSDIRNFAAAKPPPVVLHPNPLGYHIDVMVRLPDETAGPRIFFLSFSPHAIVELLSASSAKGHELMLVNRARPGLIEISRQGDRSQLSGNIELLPERAAAALAVADVPGTAWQLIDLPEPQLFAAHQRTLWWRALTIFAPAAVVIFLLGLYLRFADRRRRQAQEDLERTRAEVDHSVQTRTGELVRMSKMLARALAARGNGK